MRLEVNFLHKKVFRILFCALAITPKLPVPDTLTSDLSASDLPALADLCAQLERLDIDQKRKILDWLTKAIALQESHLLLEIPQRSTVAVGDRRHYEGKTYQHEKRRCGKAACRCSEGKLSIVGHGPYWYAYWKEGNRLRSQYIGKRPPWAQETPEA